MSCPYYQDLTRTCIQYFPHILRHSNFSTCDSIDKYENCLGYIALKSEFRCKYQKSCIEDVILQVPLLAKFLIENDQVIALFKQIVQTYCSSEKNHATCACFVLWEQGIHPPADLLPDGKTLRLKDIILRKEIIIE